MSGAPHGQRFAALLEGMGRAGVSWLWIEPSVSLFYLTGIETISIERLTGLLVSATGEQRVLVPRMLADDFAGIEKDAEIITWSDDEGPQESATRVLKDVTSLHVQGTLPMWAFEVLRTAAPAADIAVDPGIVAHGREKKDAHERALLARSAAVTDDVVAWLAGQDLVGITERQLAGRIQARYLELGHTPGEWALVASGPNAALPHHAGDDTMIARDAPLLTDFGAAIDHYWSDITRVHFPPETGKDPARAYEVVCAAAEAAFNRVEAGVPCAEVDRAARRVIDDAGLGEYFVHRTGHGIGLDVHEPPYLTATNEELLEVGNAFTIEPGVYLPGRWGLRYENVVVLEDDGARTLNRSPRMHRL